MKRLLTFLAREKSLRVIWMASLLLMGVAVETAFGQGCAQCLDNTQATPLAVQAAYRHAIILLGGFAAAIFLAGTLLMRRPR
jgi:hypothetical protein